MITGGIGNQIDNNYVSSFKKEAGIYTLVADLDRSKNDYYLVAKIRGNKRVDQIKSASVSIEVNDNTRDLRLTAGDLRSTECVKPGFCKEQILKSFSVDQKGTYIVKLIGFDLVGNPKIQEVQLHSNHSVLMQVIFIIGGTALLIFGLFQVIKNTKKILCYKALHRTSR